METSTACNHDDGGRTLFCSLCGKVRNRGDLRTVQLAGIVNPRYSTNPKMEQFFATGDPDVFATP